MLKKKARFLGKGSVLTVPVYTGAAPQRSKPDDEGNETETAEDYALRLEEFEVRREILIDVKKMDRETVIAWGVQQDQIAAAERKRREEAKTKGGATTLSGEWVKEFRAFSREVIRASVAKVHNVEVGATDLSDVLDMDRLLDLLDEAGMIVDVALAAREAQRPTPVQKKLSESSPSIDARPS